MQDDESEHNPGRAEFWTDFYADDGRLMAKEWDHRRSEELRDNGSLMDHYEWFMSYSQYEAPLETCLRGLFSATGCGPADRPLRVLHIGCGNSDLCDHLLSTITASGGGTASEILNVDICGGLLRHLARHFPQRRYAVGNCCHLVAAGASSPAEPFYSLASEGDRLELAEVAPAAVDFVCDKGTLDALMSAFAGEFNPNVEAYASEMLRALRTGGRFFLISINAEDVVSSYVLAAQDKSNPEKGFQRCYRHIIQLPKGEVNALRVETLGSTYNCYCFEVVHD